MRMRGNCGNGRVTVCLTLPLTLLCSTFQLQSVLPDASTFAVVIEGATRGGPTLPRGTCRCCWGTDSACLGAGHGEIVLDSRIRDWVLIPIFVIMIFFTMLREYAQRALTATPKAEAKAFKETQARSLARAPAARGQQFRRKNEP
jgi:hypothetical protein